MSDQQMYDDDVLDIDDDIGFSSPGSPNQEFLGTMEVNRPIDSSSTKAPVNTIHYIPRLTPHTHPVLKEPAIINGRPTTDLKLLKISSTINEVELRKNNSYQRFVTREGVHLYLKRQIIQRIDFKKRTKNKQNEQTIHLPEQYQVRLKVKANGKIIFHRYHRQGISKFKKATCVELDSSTGGTMFKPED